MTHFYRRVSSGVIAYIFPHKNACLLQIEVNETQIVYKRNTKTFLFDVVI